MVSGKKTLALYLTITLENENFNTTQNWVGIIQYSSTICRDHEGSGILTLHYYPKPAWYLLSDS